MESGDWDSLQDLCGEALFPEWSFLRNVGESAERDLTSIFDS
tara:strand:+ start:320 stop:445 length:126 start_codon:yes stop_codon:yes gene_type:complete